MARNAEQKGLISAQLATGSIYQWQVDADHETMVNHDSFLDRCAGSLAAQ